MRVAPIGLRVQMECRRVGSSLPNITCTRGIRWGAA